MNARATVTDAALFAAIDDKLSRRRARSVPAPAERPPPAPPPPSGAAAEAPAPDGVTTRRKRGRPPKPATPARTALRQAARPLWTNYGFASDVLELELLERGLAATRERVRNDPAAIARPRVDRKPRDLKRFEAALGELARHIDTAPDAEPPPELYAPLLNSAGDRARTRGDRR